MLRRKDIPRAGSHIPSGPDPADPDIMRKMFRGASFSSRSRISVPASSSAIYAIRAMVSPFNAFQSAADRRVWQILQPAGVRQLHPRPGWGIGTGLDGCSSVGRASVSKTEGRGFESLRPCQFFLRFWTRSHTSRFSGKGAVVAAGGRGPAPGKYSGVPSRYRTVTWR